MPIEAYNLKAQAQTTVWFAAMADLFRIGFEFLSGMCLSAFICANTPASETMYALVETATTWLGYYRAELDLIKGFFPFIEGCGEQYGNAIEAFFKVAMNIAPVLPEHAYPPADIWVGKCEDFWELRDKGIY